jgi:hypothetical protein
MTRSAPYGPRRGMVRVIAVGKHLLIERCPCCGYRTGCATCPVCFWTDDGRPEREMDAAWGGGPNGELTLRDARLNFAIYGACHPRYEELVRQPRDDER